MAASPMSKFYKRDTKVSEKPALSNLEEKVQDALENDKYNPSIIPLLEQYVDFQVENRVYDFDANRALLQLYHTTPEAYKDDYIVKIITKALMNLPYPDFSLCVCLIPQQLHNIEMFAHLLIQHQKLEAAKFEEFWKENNEYVESVSGFYEAVRAFIVHSLNITFQVVPKATLLSMLNIDNSTLSKVMEVEGWVEEGDGIRLTANEENQTMPKKFKENIELKDIINVVNRINQ